MPPGSDGYGLAETMVLLLMVVTVSGDCGSCWIDRQSNQEEQCKVTRILPSTYPTGTFPAIRRSFCESPTPNITVVLAPAPDCKMLTFNVSITFPDRNGIRCVEGLRLSIYEFRRKVPNIAYEFHLNGNWSDLDKEAAIHFQIPTGRCGPVWYQDVEYYFEAQTIPAPMILLRSMGRSWNAVTRPMKLPEWGVWTTKKLKYAVVADGVRAWFEDLPPMTQCYCFRFMLVKMEMGSLSVTDEVVVVEEKKGFFPINETGRYQICLQGEIKNLQRLRNKNCTDWFMYPATTSSTTSTTASTSPSSKNLVSLAPGAGEPADWVAPTIAAVCAFAVFLVLAGAILLIYRLKKNIGKQLLVIIVPERELNEAVIRSLRQKFRCKTINLSDLNSTYCRSLWTIYHKTLINTSAVILVVCANGAADDAETFATCWPGDAGHQKVLSWISNERNRCKVVPWGEDVDEVLLKWTGFPSNSSTQPLIEKKRVVILYHDRDQACEASHRKRADLRSLIRQDGDLVCTEVNMSDCEKWTELLRGHREAVINTSDVILIVCSDVTADDFLDAPAQSWPNDAAHQNILSLIQNQRNKGKLALIKWSPDSDGEPLEWIKFPGGRMDLDDDIKGYVFLNAVKFVASSHPDGDDAPPPHLPEESDRNLDHGIFSDSALELERHCCDGAWNPDETGPFEGEDVDSCMNAAELGQGAMQC